MLTPTGWKAIGDLRVGAKVCAVDGTVCEVIGVYPQGVVDIYRVTMSDGGSCEAGLEHRWLAWEANKMRKKGGVRTSGESSARVYTTADIMKRMTRKSGKTCRFAVPTHEPVRFNVAGGKRPRSIDPYLLGLLLGDGSFSGEAITITSMDGEIGDYLFLISSNDCVKSDREGNLASSYRFIGDFRSTLDRYLKAMKLRGLRSEEKFIPREYLWGPIDVRRALLQGLMDTDGWAEEKRSAYYCTTSQKLRDDIVFLARSLGCVTSVSNKSPTYTYKGEKRDGLPAFTIRIKSPEPETLFRLSRKRAIARGIEHQTDGRWIEKIEYSRRADSVCIAVSHPSSLYITDDFIVTHNTDGSLGRALIRALKYREHFKAYFVRRELVQLEPAIARSKEIFSSFGNYLDHKKTWIFQDGGVLSFRYIERDSDAEKFQGASATDLYIEEIGNFPDLDPLLKLKGILRSTAGVPTCWCATGNPGGPGHTLVKRRWIDPAPNGFEVIREVDKLTGLSSERIYIPSRVTDNMLLMKNDPGYIARLSQTGSEALVRAWLSGSFDVIDGAFFSSFSVQRNVLRPTELPAHWMRFCAGDWGSYFPFYFIWFAHASEDWVHPDGQFIPKGALIGFREWYGSQNHNNKGLKMTAEEVGLELSRIETEIARVARRNSPEDVIAYRVMDPKAFAQDGGPSHAERMARATDGKLMFRRADNKRVGKDGAMGGWDMMRQRIDGTELQGDSIKIPSLYFFDTCVDAIRTIPALQHDPDNPEDLMGAEDHPADAIRYGVMSRPYFEDAPRKRPTTEELRQSIMKGDLKNATLMELFQERERSMKGSRARNWRV